MVHIVVFLHTYCNLNHYSLGDAVTVKNGKFEWDESMVTLSKYVQLVDQYQLQR